MSIAVRSLDKSVLACTVPEIMFSTAERWGSFQALATAACLVTDQNCIGFMGLLDGTVDIAYERDLLLPDAAAIVPILQSAGIVVTDHYGKPATFDVTARDSKVPIDGRSQGPSSSRRRRASTGCARVAQPLLGSRAHQAWVREKGELSHGRNHAAGAAGDRANDPVQLCAD